MKLKMLLNFQMLISQILCFIIRRCCYSLDNVMYCYDHMLHFNNTFGRNKQRHDKVHDKHAIFH